MDQNDTRRPLADRLTAAIRAHGTPLCVGLDPMPDRIPARFGPAGSLSALAEFSAEIVDLAAAAAPALKLQIAHFERYGPDGYALARTITHEARARGLIVILDAKRGDIGPTAQAYAEAAFSEAGFGADAVTVNPYMGLDTLEPFVAAAQALGRGVAVLARTSNPGASDFQELDIAGQPLWAHVTLALAPLAARLMGAGADSGLMIVVGATAPDQARAARALAPTSLQLVPGYGAQGASAADAVAGLRAGPACPEGGLVNASRALLYPDSAAAAASLADWRAAIAAAIGQAARELRLAAGACKTTL